MGMTLTPHTAAEFGDALRALLPPGAAWDWPTGGMGDTMLIGTGVELARAEAPVVDILALAIELHTVKRSSWRLVDYQAVADGSQADGQYVSVSMPQPFSVGSTVGDRVWSERSRYVLFVQYDVATVDLQALWDALVAFKQARIYLVFVDVSGVGGGVAYAQN